MLLLQFQFSMLALFCNFEEVKNLKFPLISNFLKRAVNPPLTITSFPELIVTKSIEVGIRPHCQVV